MRDFSSWAPRGVRTGGPRDLSSGSRIPAHLAEGKGNEVRPEDQLWQEHGTATLGHRGKGVGATGGAEEMARSRKPVAVSAGLLPKHLLFIKTIFNRSKFRESTFQKG